LKPASFTTEEFYLPYELYPTYDIGDFGSGLIQGEPLCNQQLNSIVLIVLNPPYLSKFILVSPNAALAI
jgi:hypothetical protein